MVAAALEDQRLRCVIHSGSRWAGTAVEAAALADWRLRCVIHSGSRWAELQWRQQLWRLTIACLSYCEIVIQAGNLGAQRPCHTDVTEAGSLAIQNARK